MECLTPEISQKFKKLEPAVLVAEFSIIRYFTMLKS